MASSKPSPSDCVLLVIVIDGNVRCVSSHELSAPASPAAKGGPLGAICAMEVSSSMDMGV